MSNRKVAVIFDVGANVGNITSQYIHLFPDTIVYCFEPYPPSFLALKKRFNKEGRVSCHKEALSNQISTNLLNIYSNCAANSFYLLSDYSLKSTLAPENCQFFKSVSIQTNTIDNFCLTYGIENIDILKFDIQGAELDALMGASVMLSEGRIGIVYSELLFQNLYDQGCRFDEIAAYLFRFNFRLYNIYNHVYGKDGFLRHGDGIFVSEKVYRNI